MSVSGRDPAAGNNGGAPNAKGFEEALDLLERALSLIDAQGGPQDAGAHLDLAIHRLRDWIAQGKG